MSWNPAAVSAITALFDDAVAQARTAGVTWAIIGGLDDESAILAHGASGHRHLKDGKPTSGSSPMDRQTVSRIASMSKSFTAAAILRLRDDGKLRLDDALTIHVPEASGITPATADSRPVTIREALTMSAGFVTDNPWGDRQEAMTREEFADMLAGDLGHVHAPGTGFEYSNTGFALLGRVIDNVSGQPYTEYIRDTFLEPLGMTSTAYSREELPKDVAKHVATGHRLADREDITRFEAEPFDKPGVYGAMAGLYSTVDDIARWVRFLAAANRPAGSADDVDDAILHPASRREMQQLMRHQILEPSGSGFDRVRGYGFGLVVEQFPDLGEIVSHSGGYPGYGSFMAWHRATGVGIVVLANSKYAPAVPLGMKALRELAARTSVLKPAARVAAPRTLEAAGAMLDWLRGGSDKLADTWFADNMDPDISRAERRRRLEKGLESVGLDARALDLLTPENAEVITPAELRWTLSSPDASRKQQLRIEVLMDPRSAGLVQSIVVARVNV